MVGEERGGKKGQGIAFEAAEKRRLWLLERKRREEGEAEGEAGEEEKEETKTNSSKCAIM